MYVVIERHNAIGDGISRVIGPVSTETHAHALRADFENRDTRALFLYTVLPMYPP